MNDFLLGLKIFIENPILGIGFNNTEPFMMRNTYNDTGIIGQHIALNLSNLKNGASKVYWVTTNSTGEYELEINLSTGNYSVQCSYGGTSIYEKSNTSTKFTIS